MIRTYVDSGIHSYIFLEIRAMMVHEERSKLAPAMPIYDRNILKQTIFSEEKYNGTLLHIQHISSASKAI